MKIMKNSAWAYFYFYFFYFFIFFCSTLRTLNAAFIKVLSLQVLLENLQVLPENLQVLLENLNVLLEINILLLVGKHELFDII